MSNELDVKKNDQLARMGIGEDLRVLANQISKFADWAGPMSPDEVMLTAMRAQQMGVHPLNGKAFQAFKFGGKINID